MTHAPAVDTNKPRPYAAHHSRAQGSCPNLAEAGSSPPVANSGTADVVDWTVASQSFFVGDVRFLCLVDSPTLGSTATAWQAT